MVDRWKIVTLLFAQKQKQQNLPPAQMHGCNMGDRSIDWRSILLCYRQRAVNNCIFNFQHIYFIIIATKECFDNFFWATQFRSRHSIKNFNFHGMPLRLYSRCMLICPAISCSKQEFAGLSAINTLIHLILWWLMAAHLRGNIEIYLGHRRGYTYSLAWSTWTVDSLL